MHLIILFHVWEMSSKVVVIESEILSYLENLIYTYESVCSMTLAVLLIFVHAQCAMYFAMWTADAILSRGVGVETSLRLLKMRM